MEKRNLNYGRAGGRKAILKKSDYKKIFMMLISTIINSIYLILR